MEPVIALVGRPNVGKSTLFNYLTRTRDALVADYPGLTRDRQYGRGRVGERPYIVVDTGGLGDDPEGVEAGMHSHAMRAVQECDALLFLVDARAGVTAADEELARILRRLGRPVYLVTNKVDGLDQRSAGLDFHSLGLGDPWPVAASHGRGVAAMMETVLEEVPGREDSAEELVAEQGGIKVAVVGRPNVGKSTLVNRLLGEERVLVYDMPGTTRDSIFIPFERDGQRYTLIDTAGVRRRARVKEAVEKFSAIKTLQAIEAANVVVMVVDAKEGVTDQDAGLAGHVLDAGRALVLVLNKWDGLEHSEKDRVRRSLDVKLGFLEFARQHNISALHGTGVGLILKSVNKAYAAAMRKMSTPELNEVLAQAISAHEPPLVQGRRIKLRYAHQGGQNPPVIVVHGNQTARVPATYKRYLVNTFRKAFDLAGTPVRVDFKTSENPYAGRVNKLTPRQVAKKRRMIRHYKKK
ncbi:ribosome biogenesis GTPase Der [Alkalilimnicola sp. S0819]|uniref:ribosome biogenesis GTPase Der n=1 Tax=Alkalilimnicola sp. S0819 TaxID=2613922 RepID=UPI00126223AA|nr:ribosome biogenesis GTPase Der [Alkalilimnicola sp. S0819]KAB7628379.1 ribosome biogenesis GTPase Der [Alkalilimnicola sp. S0819]MPQ15282.1 ribosome biogenesis GTPase Der [Alkalilimnicola sp. S0819]